MEQLITVEYFKFANPPLKPNIFSYFSSVWTFYDNIEDSFYPLLSGQIISIKTYELIGVDTLYRNILFVRKNKSGELISTSLGNDESCIAYLGNPEVSLWPIDRTTTFYARGFLEQPAQLSILFFPPALVSIMSLWLIICASIGNAIRKHRPNSSILAKYIEEHVSLLLVFSIGAIRVFAIPHF